MRKVSYHVGQVLKSAGVLTFALTFVRKYGYLTKFADHHSTGIDLKTDIGKDNSLSDIRTVFDVGASNGSMTRLFVQDFPRATIYAFEPVSASFRRLTEGFAGNPRVKPIQGALSDSAGHAKMFLRENSGYNSLNEKVNRPASGREGTFETVDVFTLDAFCEKHSIEKIDLIKIDTVGLEIRVLKGAESLLNGRRIKYVLAECTFDDDNVQNTYFEDLYKVLKPYGFRLRGYYDQSTYGGTKYITCVNALFLLQ